MHDLHYNWLYAARSAKECAANVFTVLLAYHLGVSVLNNNEFFTQKKIVFLFATLACMLWGSAYPAIKNGYALFNIAGDDVGSKLVFAGYRFMFAGIVLLIVAAFTHKKIFAFSGKDFARLTFLGLMMTSLQYTFFYLGLANTTGVKGSIMNATSAFFGVILAHFIYANDRLRTNTVIGCLLGFAGVMAVNFSHDLLDFHFTLRGEGFVVISAFLLAAAGIYGKGLSQKMDSIVMTGWQLGIGGFVLVVVGYAMGGHLNGFTVASTSLLVYMVLLSCVAFSLWAVLLKYNRVGMVTVFSFTIPIFGAGLSALFLNERIMEWKNLVALLLVCSGIWLVNRPKSSAF